MCFIDTNGMGAGHSLYRGGFLGGSLVAGASDFLTVLDPPDPED